MRQCVLLVLLVLLSRPSSDSRETIGRLNGCWPECQEWQRLVNYSRVWSTQLSQRVGANVYPAEFMVCADTLGMPLG